MINKIIYFIGSLFPGSTANHRLSAIKNIAHNVYQTDQFVTHNKLLFFVDRFNKKIFANTINKFLLNRKIVGSVERILPDFVWIDKGLEVKPVTLKYIKSTNSKVKIIHYSPDDMMNPSNQSSDYLKCIPLYDLHVTTKSYNIDELYELGAKQVLFENNCYAPDVHKPYNLTSEEIIKYSADVSFIGGPEKERADIINWLTDNGIKITIWGNNWQSYLNKKQNIKINNGWFPDEEYSKIICATKINLAFLRKVNRDLQTTRTMEIPACGGFMLAEKTSEHSILFKENEEAVYFSDNKELKDKIEYYLKYEVERKKIARNGYKRCLTSNYDNLSMVKKVFKIFDNE